MYKLFVGLILGIVQGISEWLPISSKTQILLVSSFLLHLTFSQAYALGLFLEGGTFIAALIYFRKEVKKAILAIFGKSDNEGKLLLKYLVVVTIVTGIIAVPIYKYVSNITGAVIGIPMIVLGILLIIDWIVIKFSKSLHSVKKDIHNLTLLDFVFVGIAQGLSALPGISRSGATTSTMLFLNTKPEEAFRLSFFALLPASIGASLVTIIFSHVQVSYVFSVLTLPGLIVAIIVSTLVSLVLISGLIKFAKTNTMTTIILILGIIAILGGIIGVLVGAG
ncbi:MAG: undecaprenyl-diphosphate phosphatase [Candidatus Micrarchaeaceae archaeon]